VCDIVDECVYFSVNKGKEKKCGLKEADNSLTHSLTMMMMMMMMMGWIYKQVVMDGV
jgi:hypothetical protein